MSKPIKPPSRIRAIQTEYSEKGYCSLPIGDETGFDRFQRQANRQRLRVALREAAWKMHLGVVLKTDDPKGFVTGTTYTLDDDEEPKP